MSNFPSSSPRKDRPTAHFTPDTEALSRRRRSSATHHAYSGPNSPIHEIPGAYPEPRQKSTPLPSDEPPAGFRSSGSMPSRRSDTEHSFLGSPLDDDAEESNASTVAATLASGRPPGTGPFSPSSTPVTSSRQAKGADGASRDNDNDDEDWHSYLQSINPIAVAHERVGNVPQNQQTQSAEPRVSGGSQPDRPPGPRSTSFDEASFIHDLARDDGTRHDISSSMTGDEGGPPFPQGRSQPTEPQPPRTQPAQQIRRDAASPHQPSLQTPASQSRASEPQPSHAQPSPPSSSAEHDYSSHPINIIQEAEGIASGLYRGAENVLHRVGDASRAAGESLGAASQAFRREEEKARSYLPSIGGSFAPFGNKSDVKTTLSSLDQPQSNKPQQSHPQPQTPRSQQSQSPQSRSQLSLSSSSTPAPDKEQIESQPGRSSHEFDLYGDKLDTSQFIYEDDESDVEEAFVLRQEMVVAEAEMRPRGQDQAHGKAAQKDQPSREEGAENPITATTKAERKRRDRLSDAARHAYSPSDGSSMAGRGFGEGDIATGVGGVEFYRGGIDRFEGGVDTLELESSSDRGILPGYPTPAGMSKLIAGRMNADRDRAHERGRKPTKSTIVDIDPSGRQVNVSPDSRIIQEMLNERKHPRSTLYTSENGSDVFVPLDIALSTEVYQEVSEPDSTTIGRKLEEVRHTPIFKDGQSSARGKFEAVFDEADVNFDDDGSVEPYSGVDPLDAPLQDRAFIAKSQTPVFSRGEAATGQFDIPQFKDSTPLSTSRRDEGVRHPAEPQRESYTASEANEPKPFAAPTKMRSEGSMMEHSTLDSNRNPQEKSEIPVFKGGATSAAGRFEAEYVAPQDRPRRPPPAADETHGKPRTSSDLQRGEQGSSEEGIGAYAAPIKISVPQHSTLSGDRNPIEKSSIPVFTGRANTAAGKFEATFKDKNPDASGDTGIPGAGDAHYESLLGPIVEDGSGRLLDGDSSEIDGDFAAPMHLRPEERDLSPDRQPREKKEVPIFSDGADAAAGKYEAGFMDVRNEPQDVPVRPIFVGQHPSESAVGQYEARMEPELDELRGEGETGGTGTFSYDAPISAGRRPVERKEVPVFSDGADVAAGEYEATMKPDVIEGRGGEGQDKGKGKGQSKLAPSKIPKASDKPSSVDPVNYLGKSVKKPESVEEETNSNVYRRNEPLKKHIN